MFLYPPKTLDEVETIKAIVMAGVSYALDVDTDGPAGTSWLVRSSIEPVTRQKGAEV